MTMNFIDIFILAGSGYVCGLSVSSGFILADVLRSYVIGKGAFRQLIWSVIMIANSVTAALTPIFLIGFVVVGSQPERSDFWVRFLLFALGAIIGLFLVIVGFYMIQRARKLASPRPAQAFT